MSGYFIRIALLSTLLGCVGFSSAPISPREDALIVRGLLKEEATRYREAQKIFLELYRLTAKPEYLYQAAREGMMPGGDPEKVLPLLRRLVETKRIKGDRLPTRLLVALYARKGALREAEAVVKRWLATSDDPRDLKLAATVEADLGHYEEAVALLQKAYLKSRDEKLLLDEVILLQKKLHDPDRAIRLLETHLRLYPEASVAVYFKLIELYARRNDLAKVQELYKKLYENDPQDYLLKKIIKLSLYRRDFEGLARFLEKHSDGNEELLYTLYKELDRFDKAIALAHRRYKQTGKPKWLAEEAILTYEKARKAKRITPDLLRRFQRLFDQALKEGVDESLYLNYYGYTLIDHDLDVQRGMALVRQALKQQPDNPFYLDSLAWGLYKEGRCAEAQKVMQKVIAAGGLKEPEIRMHAESIRRCVERHKTTPADRAAE